MSESTDGPLVSVIMCTYNDESYLGEAIDSILNQTYKNFEFIIVNDGSTDQTKAIIQSYPTEKIRYFEHAENKGQEKSKNMGLSKAKGKYIAYMDGDDINQKERLAIQVEFLETHPEIGFCSTGITLFEKRTGDRFGPETDEKIRLHGLFSTPMVHPTFMMRSEIIRQNNIGYVQGYLAAEDYWLVLLLLERTKAYCIQEPLYSYRWHGKNISIEKADLQQRNFRLISRTAFKKLLGIDFSIQEHELVYCIFRGKAKINEVNAVHRILDQKLNAVKSNKLIEQFRLLYAERLMNIYHDEAPKGLPVLSSFFETKVWKYLSSKAYFKKYVILVLRCIYRSFVK